MTSWRTIPKLRSPLTNDEPIQLDLLGLRLMNYAKEYSPTRFSRLADPHRFFYSLGEQMRALVDQREQDLTDPPPPGETWIDQVGRLNMARLRAEEAVFSEMLRNWRPEIEDDPDEDPDWIPLITQLPDEERGPQAMD
jgi:hypothetical protein